MLSVFVVTFALSTMLLGPQNILVGYLFDFVTLTIPGTVTWFFKVIIATYVVTFLVFRTRHTMRMKVALVAGIAVLYYVVACRVLPDYWFNSVLCFPLGMTVAHNKQLFSSNKLQTALAVAFIPSFFVMQGEQTRFITALFFCFFVLYFIRFIKCWFSPLDYIGTNSLCFYLFHIAILPYTTSNPLADTALIILGSTLMTIIYVRFLQPYSEKLYNKWH